MFKRRQIAERFLNEISLTETASVIEIGCRRGWLTGRIARIVTQGRIVGVDSSEGRIKRAIKRCAALKNVEFYVGDAEALPWERDTFDYVVSLNSFHQYANPRVMSTEVLRILKPGGRLFLGVFNRKGGNWAERSRKWFRRSPQPASSPDQYIRYFEHSGFLGVSEKREPDYLLIVGTKT